VSSVRRVTIRDVARKAGVSVTTVSNAVNGRGRLPQATREHVKAVAQELGYRARASARRLREGRTGQIGLYCSFLTEVPGGLAGLGYYMEMVMGAAEVALGEDLALVMLPTGLTPERLTAVDVDGLIVVDPVRDDAGVRALETLGLTVVTCERDPTPGARHAGCVRSDHGLALRRLLDHLRAAGSRRVALIAAGDETAWTEELGLEYRSWCAAHRVPCLEGRVPLSPRPEYAQQAIAELLDGPQPPDAVVVAPDGVAVTVTRLLQARGLRVPEDVRVASCVDGPIMASGTPPITAIDLQPAAMGRRLAGLLAELLRDDVAPGVEEEMPTLLAVRASTGGLA
jgi:DNA-binding LacI/PurR family transcriptional regulator